MVVDGGGEGADASPDVAGAGGESDFLRRFFRAGDCCFTSLGCLAGSGGGAACSCGRAGKRGGRFSDTDGTTVVALQTGQRNVLIEDRQTIQAAGRKENPLVTQPYKAVQRSFQFIRWLRHSLLVETSWRHAIEALRPLMLAYLS